MHTSHANGHRDTAPARPSVGRSTRATFHLPTDVLEGARDAVVALSGPPARLTLSALLARAMRAEIGRLRRAHNGGAPFPPRGAAKVRTGRPITAGARARARGAGTGRRGR